MIKREYSFLVSNGFIIAERQTSEYFGDYYDILKSPNFDLIFSSSKSFKSLNIRKSGDDNEGFDFALIRALIANECCLNKQIEIEDLKLFLIENLEKIDSLFNDQNYSGTKNKLVELENKRARQMFPKAYE